jgi:3-methyladenine DNA glycosylase AlkC
MTDARELVRQLRELATHLELPWAREVPILIREAADCLETLSNASADADKASAVSEPVNSQCAVNSQSRVEE